eukprot:g27519.t1
MTRLTNYSLLCGKVAIEDADLAAVLRDLPQGLEEFFLDCWACEKLTEDILQTLAEAVLPLPRLSLGLAVSPVIFEGPKTPHWMA